MKPSRSVGWAWVLGLGALAVGAGCGGDEGGGGGGSGNVGGTDGGLGATGGTQASGGAGATGGVSGGGGTGGIAGSGATGGLAGTGGVGGSGPGTAVVVTECKSVTAGSALCSTAAGTGKGLRLVGTVLAPQEVLHGGEVLIDENGVIACVGCDCSTAPGAAQAATVTCANGVISPGLINSHDHITYANNPPYPSSPTRYDHRHEWRIGAGPTKPKITYASGAPTAVVLAAELRFVMSGATSTISAGGAAHLLRNLDTANKEGLAVKTIDSDTFPLDDASGIMHDSGCNYGTNPTTAADIKNLDGYQPHIAEGVNQAARNELTCTSSTGSGANDLFEPKTGIVHAVATTPTEANLMQKDHVWVVWSPRSNVSLYGNTAPITLLDHMGVPLVLGTDWLISGSMNLSRELACADALNQHYYGKHFSDFDLWRMVTTNAALAGGVEKAVGMLAPGRVGDIAIFDGTIHKDHRAVIAAEPKDVALVLRGGQPLYGDDALVADAAIGGSACETLDVCGAPKRACVAKDTGSTTLAAVKAAGETYAPLFHCGAPTQEPTCVPSRPNEYDGSTSATDQDGDGVPDATDKCPTVFDPPRPLDQGKQADADGDGKGDACDVCPLDATDTCPKLDANDLDGDGWANGVDNCKGVANPGQEDTDNNGVGDACEPPKPAPISIKAVRDPSDPNHPAEGTVVTLEGLYVTGVRPNSGGSRGFYMQDSSLQPFTGIFVFTQSSPPGVVVGNKVNVTGTYTEYNGQSELGSPIVTVVDPGTTLPFGPIAITNPADIATGGSKAEGYESMLLSVSNVTVTVQNPDAPQDFDEFTVTGNLRIDDAIYTALDNTYPVGTPFSKIVGIETYTFGNFKLLPRSAADLVP
jgi:cytosine/adenosine deaminase-related metal-dependent hydrolase